MTAEGVVRIIRIDRSHVRNAINPAASEKLHRAFADFESDPKARVAVLYGDEKAFCSGADLVQMPDLRVDGPLGPTRALIGKPVIAAIEGWCVAGGIELAAMCDLRVCAQDARFGFFDRRHGVPLVDGGTVRLPRLVGLGRALDLILTGREFDAVEAERIGLVNRIVPTGTALAAAVELAEQIASNPAHCMLTDRESVYASYDLPTDLAIRYEQWLGEGTIVSLDFLKRAGTRSLRGLARRVKAGRRHHSGRRP